MSCALYNEKVKKGITSALHSQHKKYHTLTFQLLLSDFYFHTFCAVRKLQSNRDDCPAPPRKNRSPRSAPPCPEKIDKIRGAQRGKVLYCRLGYEDLMPLNFTLKRNNLIQLILAITSEKYFPGF